MTYSIIVSSSVEQQLDDLPGKLRLRVLTAIAQLAIKDQELLILVSEVYRDL